jgi:hypothetical protein
MRILSASLVLLFTAVGCGSAEDANTFEDTGPAALTDGSPSSDTGAGDDVGATGDDAPDEDGGPTDDASSTDDGTSHPDAETDTSRSDTGTTATDTGITAKDTGITAKDTGITAKDTGAPPSDAAVGDPLAAARVTCVDEINKYRATLSLPPYVGWTSAGACADGQCKSDSESGTAHGAFGKCGEFAQNECPGWPGPPETLIKGCLKMMWNEGPGPWAGHGHYINMSSAKYTTVACGFYQTPAGSWWAVQDFR